jgi:DNA-binding NarL/FixJ family response regulator
LQGERRAAKITSEMNSSEEDLVLRVRVIVADDSWHYAQALEAVLKLEPDIDVVGIAYSAEEALESVELLTPDVVLLDLDLPEMGGIAACEILSQEHPEVAVVVVTVSTDKDLARRVLAGGARSYVVKHDRSDPARVAAAIRSAASGDHLLDRDMHQLLKEMAARSPDPAREAGLTPRELDVLPLIADGFQNKEIALSLGVSEQTVKNHLNNIFRKLEAKNRTQMITEARRRGILA